MNTTTATQTEADRKILDQAGHPEGPQYIGPRQVECTHYDEHRYSFYRKGSKWVCPLEDD